MKNDYYRHMRGWESNSKLLVKNRTVGYDAGEINRREVSIWQLVKF